MLSSLLNLIIILELLPTLIHFIKDCEWLQLQPLEYHLKRAGFMNQALY